MRLITSGLYSLTIGTLLGVATPTVAHSQELPSKLKSKLDGWYRSARRSAPGTWGIVVADQQGEILWGVNQDAPLIPASTVKLLTTGYARTVLGGEARRSTRA